MYIAETNLKISQEILHGIQPEEQRVTIVHCFQKCDGIVFYRIWKSTFLVEDNGSKAKLLHAFNVSYFPEWTVCDNHNGYIAFTLIFEALSKDCSSFRLEEQIPEPGGFYTNIIPRNKTDIYKEEVFC